MKRKAFTLSEVLISVGIVGLIAAIMLPMVNKYKPNENKIKYLKAYTNISELMPVIVNNKKAYPIMNSDDGKAYLTYPLLNTEASIVIDGTSYKGVEKFCRLLASGFNTTGPISCPANYDSSAIPEFKPSFESINGVQFMVQTTTSGNSYKSDIFLDVNGPKGENCFATSASCKNVDRFKFLVGGDGKIYAADARGQHYLDTRTNWKHSEKDQDEISYGPLKTSILAAKIDEIVEENLTKSSNVHSDISNADPTKYKENNDFNIDSEPEKTFTVTAGQATVPEYDGLMWKFCGDPNTYVEGPDGELVPISSSIESIYTGEGPGPSGGVIRRPEPVQNEIIEMPVIIEVEAITPEQTGQATVPEYDGLMWKFCGDPNTYIEGPDGELVPISSSIETIYTGEGPGPSGGVIRRPEPVENITAVPVTIPENHVVSVTIPENDGLTSTGCVIYELAPEVQDKIIPTSNIVATYEPSTSSNIVRISSSVSSSSKSTSSGTSSSGSSSSGSSSSGTSSGRDAAIETITKNPSTIVPETETSERNKDLEVGLNDRNTLSNPSGSVGNLSTSGNSTEQTIDGGDNSTSGIGSGATTGGSIFQTTNGSSDNSAIGAETMMQAVNLNKAFGATDLEQ